MRVILIDNETNIREGMKELLASFCPQVDIIGEANGVQSGLEIINQLSPDLIFLDVEMDDGTGMDLLSKFSVINFQVVFLTAHDKYAINAFRFSAVDFMLKPADPEDLMNAIEKAENKINTKSNQVNLDALLSNIREPKKQKIVLKDAESIHVINVEDIISLEADGSYTKFSLANQKVLLVSKNLKEYEEILDSNNFFRPHNSFLVNMNKIVRFDKKDGGILILEDAINTPVSVRRKELLLERLSSL